MDIKTFLPFIILIEGFVSIALEILTLRQLLPVAGGSIIVTSIVIGIFLLFLALGYHRGGQQQKDLPLKLSLNFLIAICFFGIGLSYSFVEIFFYFIQQVLGPHIIYPLIIYLLVITSPLIFLLGQTVPIAMNMIKKAYPAGTIGGNTLALSTVGSFFGAIFTTLVLMHYLGVAWTIVINTFLLMLLIIPLTKKPITLISLPFILFSVYYFNVYLESTNFSFTNQYANYQVMNHKTLEKLKPDEKILMINDTPSSYTNQTKQGFPYIEVIKKILFTELNLKNADILVLGAGGFTLSAENTHQNRVTYVDIDKQIKKAIKPEFTNKSHNKLIVDDARHFLRVTQKHYDAIVIDVYSDIRSIPPHLLTKEYMMTILQHLTSEGVAIFNVIANPLFTDKYSKRIDNTIRSVFPNCLSQPLIYQNAITNIIYSCSSSHQRNDLTIYSDNKNTSTTDSFMW